MAEGRHLTLEQRIFIEDMLRERRTFAQIAQCLGKSPSTISREVRARSVQKRTGSMGGNYNACSLRYSCKKSRICSPCPPAALTTGMRSAAGVRCAIPSAVISGRKNVLLFQGLPMSATAAQNVSNAP